MTDFAITNGRLSSYPSAHYGAVYNSTNATYCLDADFANLSGSVLAIPNLSFTVLSSSPIQVTNKFAGMHIFRRGMDSVKGVTFGTVRSHDLQNGKGLWFSIQPSATTWDWTDLDSWVDTHYIAGRDLIIVLFGTPTWAAERNTEEGAYGPGRLGCQSEPHDMTTWDAFCTTIATRYLGKVKYYEIWNEPNYNNDGTGVTAAGLSSKVFFFSGTYAKLSEMVRRANQALKAVDPTIKVICPAVQGWTTSSGTSDTYFKGMLAANDGLSGTMASWIDIIGVHLYPTSPNKTQDMSGIIDRVWACMDELGISKEIWDTESSPIPYMTTLTDHQGQVTLMRDMFTKAAKGIARTIYYQLDLSPYSIPYSQVLGLREQLIDTLSNGSVKNAIRFLDGRIGYWNGSKFIII